MLPADSLKSAFFQWGMLLRFTSIGSSRKLLAGSILLGLADACSGGGGGLPDAVSQPPTAAIAQVTAAPALATPNAVPSASGVAPSSTPTLDASSASAPGTTPLVFGANSTPSTKMLCINGTIYATTQDDEFVDDTNLNAVDTSIDQAPNAMWGTHSWYGNPASPTFSGFPHDEIDTDATYTSYFNPFSKAADGSLQITAEPIPPMHQGDAILNPLPMPSSHPAAYHYLSGKLYGHASTYGYIEVSSRQSHTQGMWPADLWLIAHSGSDGKGNGYTEMDANEAFSNGSGYPVYQTFHRNGSGPDYQTKTLVNSPTDENYHTYGIFWSDSTVSFLTDHQVTGGPYSNQDEPSIGAIKATGPEAPVINLQVFASGSYAAAPQPGGVGSINVQWFRWYQDTGTPCILPDMTIPAPTPGPT